MHEALKSPFYGRVLFLYGREGVRGSGGGEPYLFYDDREPGLALVLEHRDCVESLRDVHNGPDYSEGQ